MHLERNLNPALSRLYVVTGVVMLVLAAVLALIGGRTPLLARYGSLIVLVALISGAASVVSGVLHH